MAITAISTLTAEASSGWEDGKAISGRGRLRGPLAFSSERADEHQAEVLPRIFGGHAGGFPAVVAALFAEGRQLRGVERAQITFEIAPDRARWGTEIAGKVKAWAKALTGPTSLPGKYPQLINLKTAKTLGLDVPWFLQQRADEVIE
jgi:hypothetical protein